LRAGAFRARDERERERLFRRRRKLFVKTGHARVLAFHRDGFKRNFPRADLRLRAGVAGRN
jgi:hypothetical protein